MIPRGSRLLEVGGGASRIIRHWKNHFECWNVDRLEGCGHGPTEVDVTGYRLVKAFMGDFSAEIPADGFDFVFSISALEHTPRGDTVFLESIAADIDRVLKPGAYSLHCFDAVLKRQKLWVNQLLDHIFATRPTLNRPVGFEELAASEDLFVLPRTVYDRHWLPRNGVDYETYGRPLSINVLWRKPSKIGVGPG
jgi:ubiquinone/menaquinone biosynthesis C-methylase UbiE